MAKIIDGKKIAEKIKGNIVKEIISLNKNGPNSLNERPNLAIILIGEREDSLLYVELKEKEAKKVGIDTNLYKCSDQISEQEVLDMINCLNQDDSIDAILVQLPLPRGFDTDGIILAVNPEKDVDRFHPKNLEVFLKTCDHQHVMPPLIATILKILEETKYELKNKKACVVSNSKIFGITCAKALKCLGAKTQIANIKDQDLKIKTKKADLLISVVGKPGYIKKEMIKEGAFIIDIGISKNGKKVLGDLDFEDVKERAGFITPVPGGVGPITIAMLFKNTLNLYKRKRHDGK